MNTIEFGFVPRGLAPCLEVHFRPLRAYSMVIVTLDGMVSSVSLAHCPRHYSYVGVVRKFDS